MRRDLRARTRRRAQPAAGPRDPAGGRQSRRRTVATSRRLRRRVRQWLPVLHARLSGATGRDNRGQRVLHRRALSPGSRAQCDTTSDSGRGSIARGRAGHRRKARGQSPRAGRAAQGPGPGTRAHAFRLRYGHLCRRRRHRRRCLPTRSTGRLLSIRVGRKRDLRRPYYIRNQPKSTGARRRSSRCAGHRHD